MEEKVYKTMGSTGATSLVLGILTITFGVVTGILLLVNGARLIAGKSKIMF